MSLKTNPCKVAVSRLRTQTVCTSELESACKVD